ncbi:HD-GYP domain-containing protein [Spartinivicinus ruber]|uniref:HD-GYP domain-containing protein n=1 Tax=Spartinivicinus ruber TaxID=2683272 RepID=UPI0013D2297D|nr:HD-GYP domain-containing protein [Spartinivicinus ruber]
MTEYIEKKLNVSELEVGMHVVRLDKPWLETSFLLQGFIIQSQEDITALAEECNYVYIQGKFKSAESSSPKVKSNLPKRQAVYINKVSFEQEIEKASINFRQARGLAKNIMDGIRIGRALDINEAKDAVAECVNSILRNPDTLRWLTQIKQRDEYTAEHSMNVCILSATFARYLGMSPPEIEKIGLCGLLHDVGKAKVPEEILNKPGKLDPDENSIMQMHTVFGKDILTAAENKYLITVDVAHSHHERIDGTGYPRRLEARQIPLYSKIVALTDVYDAITSSRCYDGSRTSLTALNIIYNEMGTHFDTELAREFIKCIGIYPPGSIVEMTNGEVGIVMNNDHISRLKPRVLLLLNEFKEPRKHRLVDMTKIDLDAESKPYVIQRELINGSYGVDINDYFNLITSNSLPKISHKQEEKQSILQQPDEAAQG